MEERSEGKRMRKFDLQVDTEELDLPCSTSYLKVMEEGEKLKRVSLKKALN